MSKKEFDSIEEKYRNKIAQIFKILSFDPVPAKLFDIKKLEGVDDTFRIRLGRIRIIYTIIWQNKDMVISKPGMRENVYD